MQRTYVIDPGLMEAGGHHAALLQTLQVLQKETSGSVVIYTHAKLNNALCEQAQVAGISVRQFFTSNFYQHYDDSTQLKIGKMQGYIRKLAREYFEVLSDIAECESTESEASVTHKKSVSLFYPCVNWEHASALALAITLFEKRQAFSLQHKVCCMFVPLTQSRISDLHYQQAFKQLSQKQNVALYASEFEVQQYYQQLKVSIAGIHPCYLLPWQRLNLEQKGRSPTPNLLLYMGDAKTNKGFTRLPELIAAYIREYSGNVKLTVQYTLAWQYADLAETVQQLNVLAEKHSQLTVVNTFWSVDDIATALGKADAIVCTYDTHTYQHKSSGLAWLAAYFSVPVIISGECWLTREFERLGHEHKIQTSLVCSYLEITNIRELGKGLSNNSEYGTQLFSHLINWLQSENEIT